MQGLCCITDSSYTLLPSMLQVQRAFSRTLVAPVYKTFLGFPPPNPRSTHRNRKIFKSYRRSTSRKSALSSRVVCGILPVDPWAPNVDSQSIASQLFAVSLFPYLGFLYFITKSKSAPKVTLFGFYFLLAFVGATNCLPRGNVMGTSRALIPVQFYDQDARQVCTHFTGTLMIIRKNQGALTCSIRRTRCSRCFRLSLWAQAHIIQAMKCFYGILTTRMHAGMTRSYLVQPNFHGTKIYRQIDLGVEPELSLVPAGIYAKVHYGTSLSNVDWLHGGAESLLTLTNLFIVMGLREALRKKNHAKENMPEVVSDIKDEKKLPPR